jgi:hypothetical protein
MLDKEFQAWYKQQSPHFLNWLCKQHPHYLNFLTGIYEALNTINRKETDQHFTFSIWSGQADNPFDSIINSLDAAIGGKPLPDYISDKEIKDFQDKLNEIYPNAEKE